MNVHIFLFNKCPGIYTLDGAIAKLSTNPHETDYSAWVRVLVPWTADADTLRTPAGGPVHNPAGLVH